MEKVPGVLFPHRQFDSRVAPHNNFALLDTQMGGHLVWWYDFSPSGKKHPPRLCLQVRFKASVMEKVPSVHAHRQFDCRVAPHNSLPSMLSIALGWLSVEVIEIHHNSRDLLH